MEIYLQKNKKKNYYIVYTVLFIILTLFCFIWYIIPGRSFIWMTDGWRQHYKALIYYARYLREILRHLLKDHKFVIPDWDFCIGEGNDIVNALHHYAIGDPIALLVVFVPTRYIHIFYSASVVLRFYLSGVAFTELCFQTGKRNKTGILAGTLAYCFSAWAITEGVNHPFFLTPLVFFPLIILGIEKIIRKERPYLFVWSVLLSAVSNVYFFYSIAVLAVVYTLVRLTLLYRNEIRKGLLVLLKIGAYAAVGLCMAGILILPLLIMVVRDGRMDASPTIHILYPLAYYSSLPSIFVSGYNSSFELRLGLTSPAILAFLLLFLDKGRHALLKILTLICTIFILFPVFGCFLNGMSYVTNRWSWVIAVLSSFILIEEWDHLLHISGKEFRVLLLCCFILYLICMHADQSRKVFAFSEISLLLVLLLAMRCISMEEGTNENPVQLILVGSVILSVISTSFWKFSPVGFNYARNFIENSRVIDEFKNNEAYILKSLSDGEYIRYSGRDITSNADMIAMVSSTQYFWSLSNPYVNRYREELEMLEPQHHYFQGYDDRTSPLALSAAKYFILKESDGNKMVPYGYELLDTVNANPTVRSKIKELQLELNQKDLSEEQLQKIAGALNNKYLIYENRYTLPLGYCYDAYIDHETWQSMDPVQKQESLLSAALIDHSHEDEDTLNSLSVYQIPADDYQVPYKIECLGSDIIQTSDGFVATRDNVEAVLSLNEEINNAETYIRFEGLNFEETMEWDLYFGKNEADPHDLYNRTNWKLLSSERQISIAKDKVNNSYVQKVEINVKSSAGVSKGIRREDLSTVYDTNRNSYIANFGYSEKPVSSITVTFPKRGIYTYDSLSIYRVPVDGFRERIQALSENSLENIRIGTDELYGELTLDKTKILCVAIPYSTGWKGSVDGKAAEVLCLNRHYLGMLIPEGTHDITLHYEMPYKREGALITLFGFLTFLIIIFRNHNKSQSQAIT